VKGAKKHGTRIGNWLTAEQGRALLAIFDRAALRGKRDYAMVAVLLGCGLRRAELAAAQVADLQQREEHWVFADLIGKGGHIRTVPIPDWVAEAVAIWLSEAGVTEGAVFRAINKGGRIAPKGFSPKVIWGVVKQAAARCGMANVAPHDLRRYTESRTMPNRSCRCCFGVEFAVNVVKGFGIVRTVRGSSGKPIGHRQVDSGPVWFC
jgi:integrase